MGSFIEAQFDNGNVMVTFTYDDATLNVTAVDIANGSDLPLYIRVFKPGRDFEFTIEPNTSVQRNIPPGAQMKVGVDPELGEHTIFHGNFTASFTWPG